MTDTPTVDAATGIAPTITIPPLTTVDLPGGFPTEKNDILRDAVVRELTGFDEEKLAGATRTSKLLDIALQLGTVSIGGFPLKSTAFDRMLAGDANTLLLAIRRVNFGPTIPVEYTCSNSDCNHTGEGDLDLFEDIPTTRVLNDNDRVYTVNLSNGEQLLVGLSTYGTQKRFAEALEDDKSTVALADILMGEAVIEKQGEGVPMIDSTHYVRGLTARLRGELLEQIQEHQIGPDLSGAAIACSECGEKVKVSLAMGDLFRW